MMKAFTTTLHILLLFAAPLLVQGQTTNTESHSEMDAKYTPNQNSIFNNSQKKKSGGSSTGDEVTINNAIKFCPTALFRQKIVFHYEREIVPGIMANAGLGKAFGDDLLQRTFFELLANTSDEIMSPGDMISNAEFMGSSPFLYLGSKFYFNGNSFGGGFAELSYRNERMDYLLNPTVNGDLVQGSREVYFSMQAFNFGFGLTYATGRKNNIINEVYINFGVKFFKFSQVDKVQYGAMEIYRNGAQEARLRMFPSINMGYCFGFGF